MNMNIGNNYILYFFFLLPDIFFNISASAPTGVVELDYIWFDVSCTFSVVHLSSYTSIYILEYLLY